MATSFGNHALKKAKGVCLKESLGGVLQARLVERGKLHSQLLVAYCNDRSWRMSPTQQTILRFSNTDYEVTYI